MASAPQKGDGCASTCVFAFISFCVCALCSATVVLEHDSLIFTFLQRASSPLFGATLWCAIASLQELLLELEKIETFWKLFQNNNTKQ